MFRQRQQSVYQKCKRFLIAGMGLLLLSACQVQMPTQEIGYEECWPCTIYDKLYTVLNGFVASLMSNCCDYALDFLGIGLLFWLLFHVGKFVVTIQEPNLRKFIFPITTVLFRAILVVALIRNGTDYVNFIGENLVQPLLEFFVDVSKLILDSNNLVRTATNIQLGNFQRDAAALFTDNLKEGILTIIYKMYAALRIGVSLGQILLAAEGGGFAAFLFGLFVVIMFWWLGLAMPLRFTDAFVRMAVMVILSPFVLVAWVFPVTSKHLKHLWGIFLGTGINLMFSCFYIGVTTFAVLTYGQQVMPGVFGSVRATSDPRLVEQAMSCSVGTLGFFVLIFSLNRLAGVIPKLANQFGGESADSSFTMALKTFKRISIGTAKLAVAAAVASPTIAKEALGDMKEATSKATQAGMGGGSDA